MIRDLLSSIEGVGVYPIISMIIFFILFCSICIWVFTSSKKRFDEDARIPFSNTTDNIPNGEHYEK